MRKLSLTLLTPLLLILLAALIVPLFISTDLLKAQVEKTVHEQTGMSLDIGGDVSFSLLTGFRLSAQDVALRDSEDNPLFAVEQLDFALALTPLLSGNADISGIILQAPTFTLTKSDKSAPIPQSPAPQDDEHSSPVDLSALKLRSLQIRDGMVIARDADGHDTPLLRDINTRVQIPDFNGTATLSGSLNWQEKVLTFDGSLEKIGQAINGKASPLALNITSEVFKARLEGQIETKGPALLVGNYALNAGNLTRLIQWISPEATPLNASDLSAQGSIILTKSEMQVRSLRLALGQQSIDLALRAFFAPNLERPLIRLAANVATINLDKLLPAKQHQEVDSTATSASNKKPETPDLSALGQLDVTLDLRVRRLISKGNDIRNIRLLANLIDNQLSATLKPTNIAKGTIQATLQGDLPNLIWSGKAIANRLDIASLARTAGQKSPVSGNLSADLDFAAKGLTQQTIAKSGNIAGTISLANGQMSHPALQAAIAGRESGTLSNIKATANLKGLGKPVDIAGSLNWNGETIRLSSHIGLAELLAGSPFPASLSASTRPLDVNLAGRINPAKASLNGSKLSLKTASSRALLAWLGQPVNTGTPDMPVTLTTNLALDAAKTNLSNLSIAMGQSKGNGKVTFINGAKPKLDANISFDKLDVTPFMGDGKAKGRTGNTSSRKQAGKGWDKTPIDFSGLNSIDADISFAAKSMIARDIVTGPVKLLAKVNKGQLQASLDNLTLYGGQGTGGVAINGQTKPASMTANFTLQNMRMAQFLRDAAGLKALAGTGGIKVALKTQGKSQAELVSNLAGTGNLEVRDGQVRGINIPQMLRSLRGNILEGWASSPSQNTDFSALTASYAIDRGIARNTDLQMLSPLLRVAGGGTLDLPRQHVDYRVTPKLISKLKGQGGLVDADGVPIPIIIKGPMDNPRIYPDIPGILQNPQAILNSLQNLGGTGKAAAKGLKQLDKSIDKEIEKGSKKLGIDLNKLIKPQGSNTPQQDDPNGAQQPSVEQELLNTFTKGLFRN